jgi:hypothetical protein
MGTLAILASSLFAGAAIYISLVEDPARLACGTELAARQWAPSYKRAMALQVCRSPPWPRWLASLDGRVAAGRRGCGEPS